MIKVLIVDDEPPARRKVRRFLHRDPEIGEVREAGSGEEAVEALASFAPDLVFLDVQMPGIDGFTALASIAQTQPEPRQFHVIFLTAHAHHALRAFEAEALDYLLKPVDPERFERALERAKEQIALRRERSANVPATRPLRRLVVEKKGAKSFYRSIGWIGPKRTAITSACTRAPTHSRFGERLKALRSNSTPNSSCASIDPNW